LECCGVTNYTDWSSVFGRGKDVTIGCCIEKTDDCFEGMAEKPIEEARKYIYTQGCYQAIKSDLQGLTIGLGVACLILAVIQVLSITCACGIAKNTQQYA
ncbi:CD63 antigen-like 4, partial [Homarus americanus]